ncbi:FAD-dependent oxidoreductase [Spiractinospora alimapuensis]|uniref:NAD(P)/FAD-dependent oxidoreductase n=1 Tax=Spiractinospora alimapuensis TaxID=2820884 RepID=UPI001F1F9F89|nr:FAD-dependent oxidoreductase [Spiractinospora alimapuensis]QVQ54327.1 FAD-dependent oxidoreductase [Spiractinospora alimapuensis]
MTETVVIVGGGYGGITAAKALDEHADVVLVEPRDTFVHNIAALRGVVDATWIDRIFMPYDRLLSRGRVVRDRATEVTQQGVRLASGEWIAADYLVLATGSSVPFPAKPESPDSETTRARMRSVQRDLADSDDILVLGGGPTGLELSGEIKSAWPDKRVTVVDPSPVLLPALPEELRVEVRRQLDELGVTIRSGTRLVEDPPGHPGDRASFTVRTEDGDQIQADLWFRCFGFTPHTDYLGSDLLSARRDDGLLDVTPQLRLAGQPNVFVVGDIANLPEAKMGGNAQRQANVVAENIRHLLNGDSALDSYAPLKPWVLLPLGPKAGASYTEETGLLDAVTTSEYKGADLMVEYFRTELGLDSE